MPKLQNGSDSYRQAFLVAVLLAGFALLPGCRSTSVIGAWHEATDHENQITYDFRDDGLVFWYEGWSNGVPHWAHVYRYEISDDKLTLIPQLDSNAGEPEEAQVFHFQQIDRDSILLRYVTDENTTTHLYFRSPPR
ncbi:hypothetical protein OT109_02385 [Phycisphaeraceae bacterium D3-23]